MRLELGGRWGFGYAVAAAAWLLQRGVQALTTRYAELIPQKPGRAMVAPERIPLTDEVEIDEFWLGGYEECSNVAVSTATQSRESRDCRHYRARRSGCEAAAGSRHREAHVQYHTTDRISTAMIADLALIFSVPTSRAAATPALRKGDVVARQRSRAILLCIATALLLAVVAAPAGAAPRPDGSDFSCRASAVRAVFPPYPIVQPPTLEPLIANRPEAPCADGAAQIIGAQTVGPAMTETLRVATDVTPDDLSSRPAAEGDNATASSTVERATITGLPAAIAATGLTADATFTCRGGQPVGTSSGRVESLTVGGVVVPVPERDNFVVPLIWGDSLTLNQVIVEPTKITRRAMFLDVNGNTGLPDVAISEAIVGITGNPCAAAAVTPPPGRPAAATPPAATAPHPGTPAAAAPPAAAPPAATTPPAARPTPAQARRPARARLTTSRAPLIRYGANRCISPPFRARVVGVNIDHVTFRLDGEAERRDNSAPFQMRIKTPALRPAIHRLTARVVFRRATRVSPRTLRFSFRRCAKVAAQSRFTG